MRYVLYTVSSLKIDLMNNSNWLSLSTNEQA